MKRGEGYQTRVKKKPEVDPETGNPRVKHPLSFEAPDERLDWWQVDEKDTAGLAGMILERVKHLDQLQQSTRWALALNATLYHGNSSEGFLANYGLPPVLSWSVAAELGGPIHNVVASCIDTLVAMVTANKPQATFVTRDGDYNQRIRAEGLTHFGLGLLEQIKAYSMGPRYATDAALFSDGLCKLTAQGQGKDKKIVAERVLRPTMYVDEAEAYYGDARQLYQRIVLTKEIAFAKFGHLQPGNEEILYATPSVPESDFFFPGGQDTTSRVCDVYEAWKLPAREGDGSGRHVICTRSGVLLDEPWTRMVFPFVHLRWRMPTAGYWGDSLASALRGYQLKINRLDRTIDETMRRMSLGRWMIAHGSKVSPMHLGNQLGSIIRYTGQKPIIDNTNTVPTELIAERDAEIQKAHALDGISTLASSSVVPEGLKSGEALKVHLDVQTKRFQPFEDAYAQFYLDIVDSAVDLVRDIADQGGDYKVLLPENDSIREISWKSVALKKDAYIIRKSATNYMAGDPADQLDKATTLSQAAGLDIVETIDALAFPDIEAATFPKTEPLKWIRWAAYQMARKGKYVAPDESTDFVHGIPYMRAMKMQLERQGASDKAIELFLQWDIEAAQMQIKVAQDAMATQTAISPPPPPGAGVGGGALPPGPQGMPAAPAAPPTGQLNPIPNTQPPQR